MNDAVSDSDTNPVAVGSMTAGAMLRQAREAAGLHVAALAVSMKIPVKKLEALEADRLDLLLDAVFVRALASSVCRALKIDSAPILDKLPKNSAPMLNVGEQGINAPFHSPGYSKGASIPALLSKPGVLLVLALLAGAVAVVFFPEFPSADHAKDIDRLAVPVLATPVPADLPAPQTAIETAIVPVVPVVQPPSDSNLTTVAPSAAPLASVPATVAEKPMPVAPAVAKTPDNGAMVANASVTSGLVVFKAKGTTWVEVIDAKGAVQLRKTLSAGETAGASGALPLSVVIGRVDVLDVEVKGKAFSLVNFAKDNVARFEVK